MQKRGKIALIALAAAAVTTFAGCSFGGSTSVDLSTVTETTFCKGVEICGIDMEGKTKEQAIAMLSKLQQEPQPFSITLTMGDDAYTFTETDFEIENDYESAVEDAYTYLHAGSARDYYGKKYFLSKESKSFGVGQTINERSLSAQISALVEKLNRDPVEPKVVSHKGKTFTFDNGKNGITVDEKKLLADIRAALKTSSTITVEIPYKTTKPKSKKSDFDGVMQQLGTFSTTSTNNENGNLNMKLAMDYCNGTTIGPGETFSFNTIVGDSTNNSRGFVKAGVIVNGTLQDDYGGGICQASTTIYGAVIRSDLTIVERNNHMWPSTYVPIGQDAAIDYGIQDFQFRNDTKYPIYLECSMDGTRLTATVYGHQSSEYDTIEITSEQTGTIPVPNPTYQEDKSLKKGTIETTRTAREGQTASAQQIFYKNGQVVKTQALPDSYYPAIGAIYRYGPGTKINS